jgi:hypothetical protein
MALDWSKKVSFGGNSSKKSLNAYPAKTSMNLIAADKNAVDLRKVLPIVVVLAVLVALFVKFGVVDYYAQVAVKQNDLAVQKASLSAVESKLASYDSVKAEYESYGSYLSGSSATQVDALIVLNMVDQQIMPTASVTAINLKSNTLSLSLANASLDTIGNLVKSLDAQPIVSNVSVSTAATSATAAQDVTATMVVTLQQAS